MRKYNICKQDLGRSFPATPIAKHMNQIEKNYCYRHIFYKKVRVL